LKVLGGKPTHIIGTNVTLSESAVRSTLIFFIYSPNIWICGTIDKL